MAKRRIGEAASSKKEYPSFFRTVALRVREDEGSLGRRRRASSEDGFTLIELVVVTAVMPMIIGAIAVGILSVFSLQTSVTNRLTDSGDAQVVSLHVQNDVQSATDITTSSAPSAGSLTTNVSPCLPAGSTQVQLMAVILGNGSEITYGTAKSTTDKGNDLWRNVCPTGSTTPTSTEVVAHDLPTNVLTVVPPAVTITCASTSTSCATGVGPGFDYQSEWVSTQGITGVTLKVTAPESNFTYQVTAVPIATSNSTNLAQVPQPSTGCGFAVSSSVFNQASLCFVNFSPWNTLQAATNVSGCTAGASGTSSTYPLGTSYTLPMSANITNTPFTLEFCMNVSATLNSVPISGTTSSPTGACGVAPGSGEYDLTATSFPTYTCPSPPGGTPGSGSESFLGNNGFYTGVYGDPALYTQQEGSTAVVTITNIELLNSNGSPATKWQLVTGDAESTDGSESIIWQSNQPLGLLANSANSPIGNACGSSGAYAPPSYNSTSTGLSGVNTTTVKCTNASSNGVNHTGTPMLEATNPTSLTVTLNGSGLQAMFLGVIL